MQNNIRLDLCQELRQLLDQWNALALHQAATERDYARLRAKILEVTSVLESLDRSEIVR